MTFYWCGTYKAIIADLSHAHKGASVDRQVALETSDGDHYSGMEAADREKSARISLQLNFGLDCIIRPTIIYTLYSFENNASEPH